MCKVSQSLFADSSKFCQISKETLNREIVTIIHDFLLGYKEALLCALTAFLRIKVMESGNYVGNVILVDGTSLIIKAKTISLHIVKPNFISSTMSGFGEDKDCRGNTCIGLEYTGGHRDHSFKSIFLYDFLSNSLMCCGRAEEYSIGNYPNSVQQMKQWLSDNGLEVDSLGKKEVAEMLKTAPSELQKVLLLRQQLAKSSVKKYQAMEKAVCADGRARGMFQFYGANRTGRWAGRIIQMQNLPQNHLPDLAEARGLVRCGDFEGVELLYEDVPDTLSQLIRTAFVPKPGYKFIVSDFSAIEARVLAWFAGEIWRQEVFEKGGDIYCASASQMFKVPVEKHGVNGHLRQKGKIAELALGYGGSVGALKAMGALEMGLSEDELQPLVTAWRNSNQNIVRFWWDIDRAAMNAVKYHMDGEVCGIKFCYQSGMLFITLPSGRRLSYVKPKLGTNQFGSECITYEGIGGTKKWERLETYGPKLVENIVQATSRDILCYAMRTLSHCFITMHIHDELVIEASPGVDLKVLCEQMGRTPPWANGLKLRADGYETMFYKKD